MDASSITGRSFFKVKGIMVHPNIIVSARFSEPDASSI